MHTPPHSGPRAAPMAYSSERISSQVGLAETISVGRICDLGHVFLHYFGSCFIHFQNRDRNNNFQIRLY